MKLREIYSKVYRRNNFTFWHRGKEYTNRVINVTFKYSVSNFNKFGKDKYIKIGYCEKDIEFKDNVCIKDGKLIGIILNTKTHQPISEDLLGNEFYFSDGVYKNENNLKIIHKTSDIRCDLYKNGFKCNGIKYIRWKRSSGSSRVGKCLFIDEKLYNIMHKWEMCGLKTKEGDEVDLAALESYISLTSSSIIDTLRINPKNILVIPDYESVFKEDVVSVEEQEGYLTAIEKECEIKNSIFDGQGLIDKTAMGKYSDKGMILLRNRFFKCCCFNTNIQQWFKDNNITDIKQLNGYTLADNIKDIQIITTPSSIKYLKFDTLEKWLNNVDDLFGVVKYEKPPYYEDGTMVQTHYQLLNTLQMTKKEVQDFIQPTLDYMTLLKTDIDVMRHHIKFPIEENMDMTPTQSKNDIVYKLLGINNNFQNTKLYYDFKQDLLKAFTKNIKIGHVLVEGNYSTIFGNPVEMLMQSINKFTGESILGIGNIHSKRFDYNQTLIGSRSPHISISNVWLPKNVENKEIDKYFNLTKEIVCINSINENVLQRLAGCDFDSDSILLSDNKQLIEAAKKNYNNFKVAVCNVEGIKRKRQYTAEQKADLDVKTSNNLIGDIVNLSQELNTQIWDRLNNGAALEDVNDIYLDVCKLSIASGLEIDSAKKEFVINNAKELRILREKYKQIDCNNKKIKPNFFSAKDKMKGYYDSVHKNYKKHDTTMDYLQECVNSYRLSRKNKVKQSFIPFSDIVCQDNYTLQNVNYEQVNKTFQYIREYSQNIKEFYQKDKYDSKEIYELVSYEKKKRDDLIGKLKFSCNTMIYLLKSIEKEENKDICRNLFNGLFCYPNELFYLVLKQSKEPLCELVEATDGDIKIYNRRYKKIKK